MHLSGNLRFFSPNRWHDRDLNDFRENLFCDIGPGRGSSAGWVVSDLRDARSGRTLRVPGHVDGNRSRPGFTAVAVAAWAWARARAAPARRYCRATKKTAPATDSSPSPVGSISHRAWSAQLRPRSSESAIANASDSP